MTIAADWDVKPQTKQQQKTIKRTCNDFVLQCAHFYSKNRFAKKVFSRHGPS